MATGRVLPRGPTFAETVATSFETPQEAVAFDIGHRAFANADGEPGVQATSGAAQAVEPLAYTSIMVGWSVSAEELAQMRSDWTQT